MIKIVLDKQFKKALDLLNKNNKSLFITGKAGTGKSTLLRYFFQKSQKKIIVLAPTGVAALNVGGETIHSFFKFKPGITIQKAKKQGLKAKNRSLYQKIEMIVIDEISMLRADLLDCIDVFLQNTRSKNIAFGGIRMVFIGDLYQLPPVVAKNEKEGFEKMYESPYFFSSDVMKNFHPQFIELEKIYRQNDSTFIHLLNAIRNNSITEDEIAKLNKRLILCDDDKGYIYLTSTNKSAEEINKKKLSFLKTKNHQFHAETEGDFDGKIAPTEFLLNLKVGAQVMFLNNHLDLWVNGTIGKIEKIDQDEIHISLPNGTVVSTERYTWNLYKYSFDEKYHRLIQQNIGSFIQFPIRLAWAITIHKSQGKTFDKAIIDIKRVFAHGQTYVALSRCSSLEGLILKNPLKKGHVRLDYKIIKFLTQYQYDISEKKCSLNDKIEIIKKAIDKKSKIDIVYLKANDEKSKRTVLPFSVGKMEYKTKPFIGMQGFCQKRKENRIFRVDKILEINVSSITSS